MARGYTVKIWHNDVHQHQIVLRARVHLVHGFEAVKLEIVSVASHFHAFVLTALSMAQWKAYKNLLPIRRHVGSSSTSKI
jgi:hypothetical protein